MNLIDHIAAVADGRMDTLSRYPTGQMVAYAVQPILVIFWSYGEEDQDKAAAAVGQQRIERFRELAEKAGGMG